jgi:uncharacterized protein YfaS (alpha-2-macroglobulin family)
MKTGCAHTASKRTLRALLLVALAAPAIGVMEDTPYFSLSSSRTFSSDRMPSVALTAWNVDSLEFRVYHVIDPVKFFQQLEGAHQFGGRVPRPTGKPTLLERIHNWKRSLRVSARRTLRGQFTESPSAHLKNLFSRQRKSPSSGTFLDEAPRQKSLPSRGTRFAEVPLLNSRQLVLSFQQPVRGRTRWATQGVDIAVNQKGVFLVEAVHKDLRAYTILMVSDIVMITKTGRGRIVTFVADRASGAPVPDAEVSVLARDTEPSVTKTNADGLAEMKVPTTKTDDIRIVSRRGADIAVSALAGYAFGADREQWTGYIFTDRPVYRPGHTVHFKGILRLRAVTGYEVPSAKPVTVEIRGPDGKPVYQKSLTTNANGTIQDELALPPGTSLGNYYIAVRAGESYMGGDFAVEEYKKPEYEVRVTLARPRVLQGETVQAVIDARYYFGEPVNGAKVKYALYRSRYWYPLWYEPDEESPEQAEGESGGGAEGEYYGGQEEQIAEANGQLDQDGNLTISFPTEVSKHGLDYRYRIEVRVTDQGKREISGTGWVVATYGSFLVHVRPDRYFYTPASKASFAVEARDYDSKPVLTMVHVELLKWNWRDTSKSELKASTGVTTSEDGSATAELTLPPVGGSYHVRVTARTPEGRNVRELAYVWVAGGAEADFYGAARRTVQIVPDKKSYRPGETAKLLIVTGVPGTPLLVSVEGRDLHRYQVIRSNEATAVFEVPISVDDEPGFFVTANFIRNGELYQNTKRVKVPPEEHKLNLKLATDKPQYLPGETATYRIDATDSGGRPVPLAELALGVVDEAIYAIRRDTLPGMLSFFFGNEWNRVFTDSSLNYYFQGEAGKRRMRLAQLRPPSRLAQLKPERLVLPKVRKAFPDTAFWAADITTDESGRALARVPFPDSLTTWRATARGVAPDTKVGSTTLKTIVRKNLILRLALPRFFVQGDEVVISAIVHNYLATAKKTRVALKVSGLDVLEGAAKDLEIPSKGEAKVDWRVRAKAVRIATVSGQALTDEESDALELDLFVNPPGVKLSEVKGGSLANTGAAAFSLAFPRRVEPGSRSLSIRVSPSIAGSLFAALEYLTSYPYGCVEQTMSSFLPNITVVKAVSDLGLKPAVDQAALQEKIRAGLDRLYNFRHDDGGWGWWETDESHPFMTAYVVAGLAQARSAGIGVDQSAITGGAAWLHKLLARDSNLAPDLRAYIVYSLALSGNPNSSALAGLYEERSKLSPYGLALLGLALEQVKDSRAAEVARTLEQSVMQNGEEAWWPASRDEMLDFSADITPEATAYAVKFLSHQRSDNPLLPKAALWLMNHRDEGYWWSSTKQTAMVIYGLTDFLKATNELKPNLTVTVYVNGRPVLTQKFDDATVISTPDLTLHETQLQPGENRIRVTGAGQGRLYYSVRAEYFSTDEKLQKTGGVPLNILRDYFRLTPVKQAERIVYETAPLSGPVSSGDLLAVRLTVTGSDWKYLLIEDPIPSGTEFIERDNLYTLKDRPPWWEYWFTRRELHDDRMAIFQTYFRQGQQQYFYLLKVVNPGLFKVSPARVQPMYQPGFLSTSESRLLEVK